MLQLVFRFVAWFAVALLSTGCVTKQVKPQADIAPSKAVVAKAIKVEDQPRILEVEQLMQGAQPEKAEPLVLSLLEEYPNNAGLHINLGVIDIQLGQYDLALKHLEKGCDLAPGNIHCSLFKGQALLGLSRYEEAESAYRQALAIDAQSLYAHYGLGVIYDLYLMDYDKAEQHYQAFLDGAEGAAPSNDIKRVKMWKRLLKRKQS